MPTEVMFVLPSATGVGPTVLECLTPLPEEDIWLAKQKSQRTRTAYQKDVEQFIRSTGITSRHELRRADYRAVIAWERAMREAQARNRRESLAVAPGTASARFKPHVLQYFVDDPDAFLPDGREVGLAAEHPA